ncbi:MAG TPA: hypothetical protein PLB96_04550 [Syntrophales bacterium]|nr:hypothetical protein [Syntrophales bacterium]
MTESHRRWPLRGWAGLALITVFWPLNWLLTGPRTHWAFFPLWLGYCLAVDAAVSFRKGSSPFSRDPAGYAGMFPVSVLAWWLFEFVNWRTGNWIYLGEEHVGPVGFFLLSSLSFSTVIPAVFGTAELVGTWRPIRRMRTAAPLAVTQPLLAGMFAAGWAMLALLLLWPRWFFPFVWLSLFFILEPVNAWRANSTLLGFLARGDRRPILALSLGCLVCGFFWEMWNFFSYPKWIYEIPFVGFLKVFEMPALGYLGYAPFAWELFAFHAFVLGLAGRSSSVDFAGEF